MSSRMRIGELLVAAKVITQEQLVTALAEPRKEGQRLGDVLLGLGLVSETQLTQALSQQLAIPWVSLYHVDFSRPLLNLVSQEIADQYCVVPVLVRKTKTSPATSKGKAIYAEQLFVAMDDPSNDAALAAVEQYCGLTVKPMLAARSDIRAAIRVYYHGVSLEQPAEPPPAPPSPKPQVPKPAAKPTPPTLPPDELVEDRDSPDAAPELEAREIIPKPKRGPAVPMVALTLLDGTTIQLPARQRRSPSSPQLEAATGSESELTARDLVSALRAVSHGADAAEILGQAPKWEPIVATLKSEPLKGPYLGDIAVRYGRPEILESILKPNAQIAQGFVTTALELKDGTEYEGFIVKESGDELEIRNLAGVNVVPKKDIAKRSTRTTSIMPEGLVDQITPTELASLVAYLQSLK